MRRIEAQVRDQKRLAFNTLSWIVCARRQITTTELQDALGVEALEPTLDPKNMPDIDSIISACAGLVTVDELSDCIRLTHYTV